MSVDVDRLRSVASEPMCCICGCAAAGSDVTDARELMRAAAEEIERLRADVATERAACDVLRSARVAGIGALESYRLSGKTWIDVKLKQDAAIAHLRAALTEALDGWERWYAKGATQDRIAELRKLVQP